MKLQEMNLSKSSKRLNKVMESRFGFSIDYSKLSVPRAKRLMQAIGEGLERIKHSTNIHTAEKNPKYMELLLVREGLSTWLGQQVLVESEMGKSEVVLAAKDMVDSIQDMVEKISKLQNEQLPALLDSIRDQVGAEQAEAFKSQMGSVLSGLVDQLGQSRDTADSAARALAGEQVAQPMAMPSPEMPSPEQDFDQDEFAATDAAAGPNELGRARR